MLPSNHTHRANNPTHNNLTQPQITPGSFSEATPIIANVFLGMPLPLSSFLMICICMLTDVSGSVTLVYEAGRL